MNATEITNELLKRVDLAKFEGECEVEYEEGEYIYHMDYEPYGRKSVACSLTILRYNEADDNYIAVENKELCDKIEREFISNVEYELGSDYECNGGLDPAFRSWEEVNRMFY